MTGSSEGWFSRLKNGLARTRVNIVGLFSGGVIDDDFLEELEYALITADVGVQASTRILQRLRDTIKLKGLKTQDEVRLALRDEIARMLAPAQRELDIEQAHPLVIMMTGVNGAGKTTSIGKISKYLSQRGKSVLLAAGDTFRAAAREQLAVWGDRNQIEVIAQQGGDPAAVVFDAVSAGKIQSGELPHRWQAGQRINFIARVQTRHHTGKQPRFALFVFHHRAAAFQPHIIARLTARPVFAAVMRFHSGKNILNVLQVAAAVIRMDFRHPQFGGVFHIFARQAEKGDGILRPVR